MSIEFLPHTADVKVRLRVSDVGELMRESAHLVSQLVAGEVDVHSRGERKIRVTADGLEELWLAFLRKLLALYDDERFVPGDFSAETADDHRVAGVLSGETFDPLRHETQPEIKAVTRHELSVTREREDVLEALVIFDL